MDNKKLDTLRSDINSLDDKILDLLKQRAEIVTEIGEQKKSKTDICLLYTSPSPRDKRQYRMPSSA